MKTRVLLPLVLLLPAVRAAELPLPEFSSKSIGVPPLSLADITNGAAGGKVSGFGLTSPPITRATVGLDRPKASRIDRASGMPILQPDPSVDYKMLAKAPDPSVDFKIVVKDPSPAAVGK